ncbi:MAG: Crp/Fnr family transcriptional regulator [Clostridiales bacterium]|nr:Crp/Fnr family transcriptional regulator [Clostridiales bacterium]
MTVNEFYTDICQIQSPELLRILADATETRYVKKGEFLVRAGESQPDICFLMEGLLRGFFLDANGKDVTDCFGYRCGTASMAFCQLDAGNISPMTIEILEDSVFFCIPILLILQLQDQYPEIVKFYNKILISALNEHWQMKQILHQYTAIQRYQWFLSEYPGLAERVSNKNIASFLRMTPVTLSRIKRAIREEQALP